MPKANFTPEILAFILAYDGDIIASASAAGVRILDARRWIKRIAVRDAILARGVKDPKLEHFVATREERQAFWTDVMVTARNDLGLRLKASELLGKSECDFIERKIITGPDGGPVRTANMNFNVDMGMEDLAKRAEDLRRSSVPAELLT